MGKTTSNRSRRPAPEPVTNEGASLGLSPRELADGLDNVTLRAQDYVCRIDFNAQVRKREADGDCLDIEATVAEYRARDDRDGMIAEEPLARLRALTRERGERLYAELGVGV